ncbi:DNA primase small subunit PriS [Candidatus Bathyarchaeota archaeon]|nr:DNA primase small subunit PriS [Candidatus Bathyarchaeota archaeon]
MGEREFGFSLFNEVVMVRHIGFRRVEELRNFLVSKAPKDVYYSCAYYERPTEEMENKGWLGADLIFDIDADHISTPCEKKHDLWICKDCGHAGRGIAPNICPVCGSTKLSSSSWPCEICLESAKRELIKLADFMMDDFGFSPDELKIYFSGHRGYHLHVESEVIKEIGQNERKEIVDYLQAVGIDLKYHPFFHGGSLDEEGWRGRIARAVYEFMLRPTLTQDLARLGLNKKAISSIAENRDKIIENWRERGPWSIIRGVGFSTWEKIAYFSLKSQAANVDSVVTTDIHRLIRMGGTLHGKTGFRKTEVPLMSIESFNPFDDAIAFKEDSVRIYVLESPEFVLKGESYGPYRNCRIEVPTAVAILLLCKGLARLEG